MRAETQRLGTREEVGRAVAQTIADGIAEADRDGRPYVLCAPSGRTPVAMFAALRDLVAADRLPLGHVTVAMLDEYAVPDGDGFRRVDADLEYSCGRWAREHVLEGLNAAGPRSPLAAERILFPDPRDPDGFEEGLVAAGGFDLLVLATGTSDGHVAFNPPGTDADARTRVVGLADSTREDNLQTFPVFQKLDDVPRHGVTMGPGTMRSLARRTVMMIVGAEKRAAAERILAASGYEADWPASIIHECRAASILLDADAAPALTTA